MTDHPPDSKERSRGRRGRVLRFGAYGAAILVFYVAIVAPRYRGLERHKAESLVLIELERIHAAAVNYASTYNNGYPATLEVLALPPGDGPTTCQKAGLLQPSNLTTGLSSFYTYEYKAAGSSAKSRESCPPGAGGYTVTARPKAFGKMGEKSFFSDESGLIHATDDNRPATRTDPVVAAPK